MTYLVEIDLKKVVFVSLLSLFALAFAIPARAEGPAAPVQAGGAQSSQPAVSLQQAQPQQGKKPPSPQKPTSNQFLGQNPLQPAPAASDEAPSMNYENWLKSFPKFYDGTVNKNYDPKFEQWTISNQSRAIAYWTMQKRKFIPADGDPNKATDIVERDERGQIVYKIHRDFNKDGSLKKLIEYMRVESKPGVFSWEPITATTYFASGHPAKITQVDYITSRDLNDPTKSIVTKTTGDFTYSDAPAEIVDLLVFSQVIR